MNELRGEKIDIIKWTEDPREFVANALSPAKVKEVQLQDDGETALVIVPDYQLSLAIGKEGQNARLAARLTGLRVDIKSESQIRQETEPPEPEEPEQRQKPRRQRLRTMQRPPRRRPLEMERGATTKLRNGPLRTCAGCRRRRPQEELTRVVRSGSGDVVRRSARGRSVGGAGSVRLSRRTMHRSGSGRRPSEDVEE